MWAWTRNAKNAVVRGKGPVFRKPGGYLLRIVLHEGGLSGFDCHQAGDAGCSFADHLLCL